MKNLFLSTAEILSLARAEGMSETLLSILGKALSLPYSRSPMDIMSEAVKGGTAEKIPSIKRIRALSVENQEVRTFLKGKEFEFNGNDKDSALSLASSIYLYEMLLNGHSNHLPSNGARL